MQMASWKKALGIALICCFVFASTAHAQVLANPLYDQGMEAFNAQQYGRSQQTFQKVLSFNANDEAAMYMYALSCQKLGQNGAAIAMYKQIMAKFPDSAACTRSQAAMAMLAPGYLKSWSAKQIGKGRADGGQGVAPDLFKFVRELPAHDLWHFERLGGHMIVDSRIDTCNFKANLDKTSEFSFIGVNQLREKGRDVADVKDEDRVIYRCDVDVANIHRQQFPMHLVSKKDGQPTLGQDFLKNYNTTVNAQKQTIFLQRISNLPAMNTKRENPIYDFFEVPFRKEGGQYIVTVHVDSTAVPMVLAGSDITQFTPDQIRAVNPGYLEEAAENTAEMGSGGINTFTGTVKLKYMRLGKIDRRGVPAKIVEFGNARYQAMRWGGSNYAMLGTEFYKGWIFKLDDKTLTARFIREIPKDAGPGLGQPQQ
jgi:hypothetical protein